jgi:uncharacterized protein YqeY
MLRKDLNDALKAAMIEKDKCAVATLRLILAAIKDRDIAERSRGNGEGLTDSDILELLQKMIRQRHESATMYRRGDREELAEREEKEIKVIQRFLPKPLTENEIKTAIQNVVDEIEASSIKDMGKVIGILRQRYPGRMDFSKVSGLVKANLT